jgi:D-tyrosyl-tRNA(Tyr) deacylase
MKIVVQRVKKAKVEINKEEIRNISQGIVALVGFTHNDSEKELDFLAEKLVHLRIFEDMQGKMNKSLLDIQGQIMLVSQFTLYADSTKGRRPNFINAAKPEIAVPLYKLFVEKVNKFNLKTVTGEFAAEMNISLVNNGPVTIILEKNAEEQ